MPPAPTSPRPTAELPSIPGFEVLRRLGKGGMGEVFEAVRVGSGGFRKAVALKTLSLAPTQDPALLERFLGECRITAQLEHPNIVRVYDLLTLGERHFLVMELLRGRDLAAVVSRGPRVPEVVAMALAVQALDGLVYAHGLADEAGRPLGLIHRDLTPRNLFLCENGTLKILDFGLVKLRSASAGVTQVGSVAGTPAFLSPEQAQALPVDVRADVYQLGAALYFLLAGQVPHPGTNAAEQLRHAAAEPPVPLAQLRPDLSPAVQELIGKAMARDPEARFPDARAMRAAAAKAREQCGAPGPEALSAFVAQVPDVPLPPAQPAALSALAPADAEDSALGYEPTSVRSSGGEEALEPTAAPSGPGSLPSQELVAGRYRIVRFLAQGGMGSVYEAADLELGETVALKTIRSEIASDERAVERFKQEIHLARKVTHPNVCRIFDIGYHQGSVSGSWSGAGRIIFLTMELLQGETLQQRLRRQGRLSPAEVLPIAAQMAAGLTAAHAAGIIHRDFKAENVVLVPGEAGAVRAVITDFGLARPRAGDASVNEQAALVGSPSYMAPEQVEGGPVTPATDVYAFGTVLFEMLTGRLPFEGDSPLAVALERVRKPAPSPRSFAPELEPRWSDAISRCLERDPARRFASAEDVVRALAGEEHQSDIRSLLSPRTSGSVRRRWPLALAAALAVAVVGAGVEGWRRSYAGAQAPRATNARRSVAVLGFQNLSGKPEQAWLSTALAETLTAELAAGGTLRAVPGENVARLRRELQLSEVGAPSPELLGRLHAAAGADLILSGAYLALGEKAGGKLRLDVQLYDAARGEELGRASDSGTEQDLLDVVSRVGAQLRERLGLAGLSESEQGQVRSTLPAGREAMRLYAEALARMHQYDPRGAKDLLVQAAQAEPDHPLIHSALSAAWVELGYEREAATEGKRAVELAGKLSREERLAVESQAHEAAEEWDKAIEKSRALWTFFPDNLEYGLRLAKLQTNGGRAADAFATVEALRALPAPMSEDARVDYMEASAAQKLGDYKRQLAASGRTLQKADAAGERYLAARARLWEGWALQNLGRIAAAKQAIEDGVRRCDELDLDACRAEALNVHANLIQDQGELDRAKAEFNEALALVRKTGDTQTERVLLFNLATVLKLQADYATARGIYEQLLKMELALGTPAGAMTIYNNFGTFLSDQGDLRGAAENFERVIALAKPLENKTTMAGGLVNLGEIHRLSGDLNRASARLGEALALFRELDIKAGVAYAKACLGAVELDRGNLPAGKQHYQEALALQRELGDRANEANSKLALAAIALEEGRPAEGEPLAREAVEEVQREKSPAWEVELRRQLARLLLAQKKIPAARAELDAATALAQKAPGGYWQMMLGVTAGELLVAEGRPREAVAENEAALQALNKSDFVGLQLEASVALGQARLAAGQRAEARRLFEQVERDAERRGYGRIAAKARAALRSGR